MKPKLQALVLADHVYQDMITGKKVIAGTFNSIWSRNFGDNVRLGRTTYAYISLTNVRGKTELSLRYVDLSDESQLLATPLTVESENPLTTVELVIEVPPFPLPKPGIFAFEVVSEDDPIGSLRIAVNELLDDILED